MFGRVDSLSWDRDAEANGRGAGLAAGAYVELSQDGRDVMADGLLGDEEAFADLGVAKPLGDQLKHLDLSGREPGRVLAGRRPRPSRQPPRSTRAKPPGDDRRRRCRAERLKLNERAAQGIVIVRAGERQGRLVATAELRPELRRALVIADKLGRIRLGGLGDNLLLDTRAAAPNGNFAKLP